MSPAVDPRIQSPWGRIALAFGLFLLLTNVLGLVFLLSVVPWDPEAPVGLDVLNRLLEEPQILGGLLAVQAAAGIAVGVFMAKRVDRRPLAELGVGSPRREAGALLWGILLGAIPAAVVTLFIAAVAGRHVRLVAFEGAALSTLAFMALVVVAAAFMEEWLFRGYLYINLREMYSQGRTVALSAVAFGMVHGANPSTGFLAWLNVVIIGVVLGQLREITGGIFMPLGLHIGWNLCLGMLFGVKVSGLALPSLFHVSLEDLPVGLGGGGFGPEASGVLTVLFTAMAVLLGRRMMPRQPPSGPPSL